MEEEDMARKKMKLGCSEGLRKRKAGWRNRRG
jgi:hypothetical protein